MPISSTRNLIHVSNTNTTTPVRPASGNRINIFGCRLVPITMLPLVLILSGMLSACGKPDRDELIDRIEAYEIQIEQMFNERRSREEVVEVSKKLQDEYVRFARAYPADSLSVIFLFQTAMHEVEVHDNPQRAIQILEDVASRYPDHPLGERANFLVGFTYSERLRDFDKAVEAYKAYLERYPQGIMAESVRYELSAIELRLNLLDRIGE